MKSMVLGLLVALLLCVIELLTKSSDFALVVSFIARLGCVTVVCWAVVEAIRGVRG